MTDRERFMQTFEQEHAVTVKVMKAYPADKLAWRPHERSMSARELLVRMAGEMKMIGDLPGGGFPRPASEPKVPEVDAVQISDMFASSHKAVASALAAVSDSDFDTKSTSFFGMQMKLSDACWLLMKDQIHHRGQLSVYIRLAGGKVPSIYGPSADDRGGM